MKNLLLLQVIIMAGCIIPQADKYEIRRIKMVETQIRNRGVTNPEVLNAMKEVPRHLFIPDEYLDEAYNDYPLPIGYGQTISQPFIVAYMTEAVRPTGRKKALEIGTGSGYQAAVMAEIVDSVYTIEIVPELAKESAERLKSLGYDNIICKYGDGYKGWEEYAPFDIIVVTAAPEKIPKPLIDQLAEGGRLIIPVGTAGAVQDLVLVTKSNGKTETRRLSFVRFVPFRRL
ncbi:MAG: protein-L-isoaspartate(D-aspartate) O-methyltransferase [Bacteroidota bacterium]